MVYQRAMMTLSTYPKTSLSSKVKRSVCVSTVGSTENAWRNMFINAERVDLLYISLMDRQMTDGPFNFANTSHSFIHRVMVSFCDKCMIVSGSRCLQVGRPPTDNKLNLQHYSLKFALYTKHEHPACDRSPHIVSSSRYSTIWKFKYNDRLGHPPQ